MIKFEIVRFDNFEIDPIDKDDNCIESEEGAVYWTVFGHLPEGGREALIDCRNYEQARELRRHFELYLEAELTRRNL